MITQDEKESALEMFLKNSVDIYLSVHEQENISSTDVTLLNELCEFLAGGIVTGQNLRLNAPRNTLNNQQPLRKRIRIT